MVCIIPNLSKIKDIPVLTKLPKGTRPTQLALLDKYHIMYSKTKTNNPNKPITAPSRDFELKYNCRVRYYPDNQIRITCFSKPIFNPNKVEEHDKKIPINSDTLLYNPFTGKVEKLTYWKNEDKPIRGDSVKRAIDKAFEIGLSNDFHYFLTLTLDEKKIDRYNKALIYKKLRSWLNNRVERNQMDYILFPEYHKTESPDGAKAIHFHALVNAQNLKLKDSGHKTKSGQTIYNLGDWKYGFSTVIELDGRTAVVRYVMKYISKEENERIFDRSYLSGGKTLKRKVPEEFINLDYCSFEGEEYYVSQAKMSVKYKTFNLDFEVNEFEELEGLSIEMA